ncbi:MAG: hypothetical protein P4L57_12115 [Rhizomicrobium sp.]|nr:hypothetical protein [Rhizomicrobium sp.]
MKKIPVRQTIAASYRFTFAGLEKVIALIWLPMIVITVGDYFSTGASLSGRAAAVDSGDFGQMGPVVAAQFAFGAVELVLMCVMGVAIAREILCPMEQRPSFLRFSLGLPEMRAVGGYAGLYVLAVVVALVCGLIGMGLGGMLGGKVPGLPSGQAALGFAGLFALVLLPVLLPIFVRLGYFIVPSALSGGKYGLEQSWGLAKGNVLRIIAISLAVTIPPALVAALATGIVLGPDVFVPHWDMLTDKGALDRIALEQMRQRAAHLPMLEGVAFILAPFLYGLCFSAPAFAYKFLTAKDEA